MQGQLPSTLPMLFVPSPSWQRPCITNTLKRQHFIQEEIHNTAIFMFLCVATIAWSWWFCWSLQDSGHYQNLHLDLKCNTKWEAQAPRTVAMQQHPGVCSSITPQFSFSWEPRFTALVTGLLSNHCHKEMQEAEEFTF